MRDSDIDARIKALALDIGLRALTLTANAMVDGGPEEAPQLPKPPQPPPTPEALDGAWLAGVWEIKGKLGKRHDGGRAYPFAEIHFSGSHAEAAERAASILGRTVMGSRTGDHRIAMQGRAIEDMLDIIAPYLGPACCRSIAAFLEENVING